MIGAGLVNCHVIQRSFTCISDMQHHKLVIYEICKHRQQLHHAHQRQESFAKRTFPVLKWREGLQQQWHI